MSRLQHVPPADNGPVHNPGIQFAGQIPRAPQPAPPPNVRVREVVKTIHKNFDLRPLGVGILVILVILVLALIGIFVLVKKICCCCCRSSTKSVPAAPLTVIHPQIHHPQPFPQGAPVHMAGPPGFRVHSNPTPATLGFMVHPHPTPAPPRF